MDRNFFVNPIIESINSIRINDAAQASSFWALYGSIAKLYISTDREAIGSNNVCGLSDQ